MSAFRSFRCLFQSNITPLTFTPSKFKYRTKPQLPKQHVQFHTSRPNNAQQYRYNRWQQTSFLFSRWAARPTFYYEVGGLSALTAGFYTYNLETVPVSGRKRFNLISAEQEAEISKQQYGIIMEQYRGRILPGWDKRTRRVEGVLRRLVPRSGLEGLEWSVHVVESEEVNAFVIPGGKVFVFTGILPICENEDGIAAVLGHEIAHNVAHHAAERMSRGSILTMVSFIFMQLTGLPDVLSSLPLTLAFDRPNGRAQESEADYIGLMMMAQACYDPEQAEAFWKRMRKAEKGAPPEFLSTHPSSEHRIEHIQRWLPEAQQKRNESECGAVLDYADDFKRAFPAVRW
ncbi:hypothetical protein EJ08DRAFT_665672 [Tothia fuscella]|uniref:Peptidase M48 domain-containing protein n=1 Tax=Tothia fuscella TaxID=1048955 RepID=A0A9P4TT38_9PEZI|nr:hypothetical protein EJ08DRAFT_665672 [Tothia fuscella]